MAKFIVLLSLKVPTQLPKQDKIQKTLSLLRACDPESASGKEFIRTCLAHSSNLIVKRAASLVHQHKLDDFEVSLIESLSRLLKAGAGADKGCDAKNELTRALCELEVMAAEDLFLQASSYVQKEFLLGKSDDTAATVRGLAGIGLVRTNYPGVLEVLADLLSDPEPRTRSFAAQAILEWGREEGAALLRLRLRAGERDAEVTLDCLLGILILSPERGLRFTKSHTETLTGPLWEAALLALGQSRSPGALEYLIQIYPDQAREKERGIVLQSIALNRSDEALEFLKALESNEAVESLIKAYWGC